MASSPSLPSCATERKLSWQRVATVGFGVVLLIVGAMGIYRMNGERQRRLRYRTSRHVPSTHPVANYLASVALSDSSQWTVDATETSDPSILLLSPTEQAVLWLMQESSWQSRQSNVVLPTSQFSLVQRFALLTLWFQQFQRPVVPWTRHDGWAQRGVDECTWYGISCTEMEVGGTVGRQNAVTSIALADNAIQGSLSVDLGLLESLESLVLSNNSLTGTLPVSSLNQWTKLRRFDVEHNHLWGSTSDVGATWTQIQTVHLGGNPFEGFIPTE